MRGRKVFVVPPPKGTRGRTPRRPREGPPGVSRVHKVPGRGGVRGRFFVRTLPCIGTLLCEWGVPLQSWRLQPPPGENWSSRVRTSCPPLPRWSGSSPTPPRDTEGRESRGHPWTHTPAPPPPNPGDPSRGRRTVVVETGHTNLNWHRRGPTLGPARPRLPSDGSRGLTPAVSRLRRPSVHYSL